MRDRFVANFQGTRDRPPVVGDLRRIKKQPGETLQKYIQRFKHNIRDEWLARHLGQEKPKSMAALTVLMTRFCAGETAG